MAGGELNTSAGGIHPGKPIIWPTGKGSSSSSAVDASQATQTAGGVKGSAPASTTAPSTQAGAVEAVGRELKAGTPAKSTPNIARALTMEDIKAHLQSIGVPDTEFNSKLASTMLRDGVELSRANFVKLLSMLQGTEKGMNMQEAAILLLMKGIDSPKALQTLANYFAQNPQMTAQLAALQESMGNLTSAMGAAKGMLDPSLVSQLGALFAQFDDMLQNLASKYQFSGNNKITAKTMMDDLRGMKALLEGVQGKMQQQHSESAGAQALSSTLAETLAKADAAIANLAAQGILSQKGRSEVNYLYEQIPNQGANADKNIEIVVQRDGKGKKSKIDYENTQIVMSMHTTNLGKMVCSVIVKGKRVYVIFIFNEKEYGDEARQLISQEFAELQKKMTEKNFVVSGYQVKVDPAMCSVKPYLIPLVPNLEQQLRKIDLET
ncbi:hypothetical protein A2276_04185 [candidate division WOR-1 bacterium RIFOXYA12_FULL_43_27]|uniref:Flagellar hook-length control protein-like C-terminal domain-containing protein n=1 Tax=candidate division WOR-1 bacterium RIFOXYC2_FULL_46_14 TaxID=1802587 RepID=A0A1F4U3C6_UNCSA|nr:MAG: hypothetical protein A2276_04185 [candidate division WOR-1 bacterium RIFOXYA12_FULL_43_27]OGC19111.1 MAG: hypothetical protein A2292_00150 [candidate division WOR-1 bacterium RIFOXYB2_FULL_46_45]OGC30099.1 MAG: hypothetical protein A2232_00150 [candidate division WOR-1 bacterium RIFOXYA2_FULL_46_56]OGC39340.1 MAG: hypothetical protein A2438_00150 [candidate division WOR-1 bacterium RIFOXYC2_FULL_46_14]